MVGAAQPYLVPHSWHLLVKYAALMRSKQQKMGFSRSVSQHGSGVVVGEGRGGAGGGVYGAGREVYGAGGGKGWRLTGLPPSVRGTLIMADESSSCSTPPDDP